MLRRRLYLQIYLTIIAILVMVVVLSATLWNVMERDRVDGDYLVAASRLATLVLPAANGSLEEQRARIEQIGTELDIGIGLFDANEGLIASYGTLRQPKEHHRGESGWHRTRDGPVLTLALDDGRWLVINPKNDDDFNPLLSLLVLLGIVAICVGLAAFPLVRRLTKRLEQLQHGVEAIGAGDLKARVAVKGRDEIAQLAESFNNAAEKIEKLVEAHRLLLANASHELRTPLSRIRLGLEMGQEQPTPERRAALRQDIAELDALIDEILLMSRLDARERIEDIQPVDLIALAAEECARFDDCLLSGTAPEIMGDQRLLHRLLRNLLENAQKHGAPPIEVEISSSGNTAILTVRDSGAGIRTSDRDRVFQPFHRGSDRQNVKGYGLGLPLVRQIAEAHGGSVRLVDPSEHPSAVEVTLPISA